MKHGIGASFIHYTYVLGKRLTIVYSEYYKRSYLIGVEFARTLLGRQTFNVYRTLVKNGYRLKRASETDLSFMRKNSLHSHANSMTFVPYKALKYAFMTTFSSFPKSHMSSWPRHKKPSGRVIRRKNPYNVFRSLQQI